MCGIEGVSLGHTVEEDAGRVRKGSGPRVMDVLEELDHRRMLLLGQSEPGRDIPPRQGPPREVGWNSCQTPIGQ